MESSPHNLKEEQLGFRNNSPCLKRITRGRDSTKQQAGSTLLQAGSTLQQAGSRAPQVLAGSRRLPQASAGSRPGEHQLAERVHQHRKARFCRFLSIFTLPKVPMASQEFQELYFGLYMHMQPLIPSIYQIWVIIRKGETSTSL
jgi:hypothetical protein